jgi:sugar/nucleoside kinase (ribokinase family)/nucleoside 2-deoxyribosyltransferase
MAAVQRIFLSSTYSDLAPYRAAVENMVQQYGELFVGMEHFGARSQTPLETCLEEVKGSDVLLVMVGGRYGSLTDAGTSFTQQEVERARDLGIPVYAFLQENPAPASRKETARRKAFVRWLKDRYTWASFNDKASLVTHISAALRRLERTPDLSSESDAWRELVQRAGAAADWDCVALTAHNVDHLFSVDRVAADYETEIGASVIAAGGSGANTMAGLGRMGLQVAAAGAVGRDEDGEKLRKALESDGVTPLLAPIKGNRVPTGSTIAFSDSGGHRSIYVEPGANARFAAAASKSYLNELRAAMQSARIVHYSSFTHSSERKLQENLLGHLSEQAILSFTPGALYCKLGLDRLLELLSRANVIFLYERQLDVLLSHGQEEVDSTRKLEEKVARLYEWKKVHGYREPLVVVIKNALRENSAGTSPAQLRGLAGREVIETNLPTQALSIGAPAQVRDSTGAGDASAAGLLWALLHGQPFNYAMDLAYVFALSASQKYGGRDGLPTPGQLRYRWRNWVGSPHNLPLDKRRRG